MRENHVVEFDEGRRIAWMTGGVGLEAARAPVAVGTEPGG